MAASRSTVLSLLPQQTHPCCHTFVTLMVILLRLKNSFIAFWHSGRLHRQRGRGGPVVRSMHTARLPHLRATHAALQAFQFHGKHQRSEPGGAQKPGGARSSPPVIDDDVSAGANEVPQVVKLVGCALIHIWTGSQKESCQALPFGPHSEQQETVTAAAPCSGHAIRTSVHAQQGDRAFVPGPPRRQRVAEETLWGRLTRVNDGGKTQARELVTSTMKPLTRG